MTLEELKNLKVSIIVNKQLTVGADISDEILEDFLTNRKNLSKEETIKELKEYYYGYSDMQDVLDYEDYNITINE